MWSGILNKFRLQTDAVLACIALGLILLLVVPLPPILLDCFLSLSIVFSVITLLMTLYIEDALEFSSFPSLLLFLTLFRLGLNIASTRMILTRGEGGDIIDTFGEFVIQGNIAVGMILFLLLTVINFIVVTKGAGRIAEVAARFTLEALPGKQLAIDGELSGGLLTQEEAKKARAKISQEAEFYGAMDGASKFVRGDAIAGLVITGVNIIGGLIVGFFFKGYTWSHCFHLFTRLTVGDGLITQIPALLISLGAGMMVTRASKGSLGEALSRQIFRHSKVMGIAGGILLGLSVIPGMPFFVMSPIAVVFLLYAYSQRKTKKKEVTATSGEQQENYPIEILMGYGLTAQAEALYGLLGEIRSQIGGRLGIRIPSMHLSSQSALAPHAWEIKIKGTRVAKGRESAINKLRELIVKTIESHAHLLINRQDVVQMLAQAKQRDAEVVAELIPNRLSPGELLKILQSLLKEGISIKNFERVLEILADVATGSEKHIEQWTEKVRKELAPGLIKERGGRVRVITLDPKVEQMIYQTRLDPRGVDLLGRRLIQLHAEEESPVLLTTSVFRLQLKKLTEKYVPGMLVLAFSEMPEDVEMQPLATITHGELL